MKNLESMEKFEQLKNEGKHLFVFSAGYNGKELGRFVSKARKTQEEVETFFSGLK